MTLCCCCCCRCLPVNFRPATDDHGCSKSTEFRAGSTLRKSSNVVAEVLHSSHAHGRPWFRFSFRWVVGTCRKGRLERPRWSSMLDTYPSKRENTLSYEAIHSSGYPIPYRLPGTSRGPDYPPSVLYRHAFVLLNYTNIYRSKYNITI